MYLIEIEERELCMHKNGVKKVFSLGKVPLHSVYTHNVHFTHHLIIQTQPDISSISYKLQLGCSTRKKCTYPTSIFSDCDYYNDDKDDVNDNAYTIHTCTKRKKNALTLTQTYTSSQHVYIHGHVWEYSMYVWLTCFCIKRPMIYCVFHLTSLNSHIIFLFSPFSESTFAKTKHIDSHFSLGRSVEEAM